MPTTEVLLSEEQSKELSSIAQSRSLPAGYVFRARLILMLAEGATFQPSFVPVNEVDWIEAFHAGLCSVGRQRPPDQRVCSG